MRFTMAGSGCIGSPRRGAALISPSPAIGDRASSLILIEVILAHGKHLTVRPGPCSDLPETLPRPCGDLGVTRTRSARRVFDYDSGAGFFLRVRDQWVFTRPAYRDLHPPPPAPMPRRHARTAQAGRTSARRRWCSPAPALSLTSVASTPQIGGVAHSSALPKIGRACDTGLHIPSHERNHEESTQQSRCNLRCVAVFVVKLCRANQRL